MKYMYKNASVEAANRVNYYRSLIKQAASNDFMSSLGQYKNPLIGAGLGMGLGYLLAPEDKGLLYALGGGALGGLAGWGYDNWFGGKGVGTSEQGAVENATGTHDRVNRPNVSLTRNEDGSVSWNPPGYTVNIPANQVSKLEEFFPDIWDDPRKYLVPHLGTNYYPKTTHRITGNKPYQSYFESRSKPHITLSNSVFTELDPEKQLDLFYMGLGNPAFDGRNLPIDTLGLTYNEGLDNGVIYYLGQNNPALAFLANPKFYTTENKHALFKLMQDYNLSSYDLGNPYTGKWTPELEDAFIQLGKRINNQN